MWIGAVRSVARSFRPLDIWRRWINWSSPQLALTLHTDSANELLETLSLPLIDDGPVDINFRLSQQATTAHLDLDAVFGEFSIFGTALSEDPLTLSSAQLDLVATGLTSRTSAHWVVRRIGLKRLLRLI